MKINRFKIIAALLAFLTVLFFSACSDTQNSNAPTLSPEVTPEPQSTDPYAEHLEVVFMPRKALTEKAALSSDDTTIKYLEEKYNITFSIINTSSQDNPQSYSEILASLISAGNIPDFMDMDVLGINAADYSKLLQAGVALDIGAFAKGNAAEYPMLQKHIFQDSNIAKFASDDGNLYCMPHYIAPNDTVYLVRGDWLEKAGYKAEDINTLDKFSELMNVLVEKDYDGKDAVGFSTSAEKYLYPIYAGYTGAYMFKEKDGYYADWYTLYELRESLGYLYLMFETRAFDREYLSHDGAVPKEKITTGRAGCVASDIANLPLLNAELQENIPEGYLVPLPVGLQGPAGTTRFTDKANPSANVISVYFEDPKRIFNMCELIFSDEGHSLVSLGLEGVHYTKEGENIVPNYAAYDAEGWKYKADGTVESLQTFNEIRNIITNFEVVEAPEYSAQAIQWYSDLLNYDNIMTNPFEDNGFNNSKVYASMTSVKDKWVDDFISGSKRLTDKNWDAFVEEYLTAGAQEQMDFYNSRID